MTVFETLKNVKYQLLKGSDANISGLSINSKEDLGGAMYICLRGLNVDGHSFAAEAIEKGASCIVCDSQIVLEAVPDNVTVIKVEDTRSAMSYIASNFYGNPSEEMELIGVTGTNGKTSTVFFISELLNSCSIRSGSIGTLGASLPEGKLPIGFMTSTTPDPIELNKILKEFCGRRAKSVAMEVSSHALAFRKVDGIRFRFGVFTNLSHDHLDFHKTMDNYIEAKAMLFERSDAAIINADDEYAEYLAGRFKNKAVTYGVNKQCEYKAENVTLGFNSIGFDLIAKGRSYDITVPVPGKFTVYNILAAIAVCAEMGIPIERIQKSLMNFKGVPGRIQPIENHLGINIFVDYSHTPDSLEKILHAVRQFTKNRIITVVGCGGDRDRFKRPVMGKIAYEYSDVSIFTSDNPRSEEPDHILIQMVQGLSVGDGSGKLCKLIVCRREAIHRAIAMAGEGDSVIIAGKGHEDYQEFRNNTKIHFDDSIEASNAAKELKMERDYS